MTPKVSPATLAPGTAQSTIVIPKPNTRTGLVRISVNDGYVHYVDELSVKPSTQKDVVEVWALQVLTKPDPSFVGASAVWVRCLANCKMTSRALKTHVAVDKTGNELKTYPYLGGEMLPASKTSVAALIIGGACQPGSLKGERFTTIAAAIADGLTRTPATSKPATSLAAPSPGTRMALVKVSASNPEYADYADELSVKPSQSKGLVEIWALQVFGKDIPRTPGARAMWGRYFVNCKDNLYSIEAGMDVDQTGTLLKTLEVNHEVLAVPKGSAAEEMAGIACKTASPKGQRLTTVSEAITDAYPPPPADPFTVGSKMPPGPATKTRLLRIGTAANSVWYVDEETFDPAPNSPTVVGWVLRVLTKADPAFPGSDAVWLRYHFGCGGPIELTGLMAHGGVLAKVEIDQTGKTRKATTSNADEAALRPIIEGSIAEKMSKTACYVDHPNTASQLTVAAAIKDAAKPQ